MKCNYNVILWIINKKLTIIYKNSFCVLILYIDPIGVTQLEAHNKLAGGGPMVDPYKTHHWGGWGA
jgi:hypothetical protein